jgi:hypothetical protein
LYRNVSLTPDKQGGAIQTFNNIVWMDPVVPSWLDQEISMVQSTQDRVERPAVDVFISFSRFN